MFRFKVHYWLLCQRRQFVGLCRLFEVHDVSGVGSLVFKVLVTVEHRRTDLYQIAVTQYRISFLPRSCLDAYH
jgi:hypothetical protein